VATLIVASCFAVWVAFFIGSVTAESARWTLSSVVQGMAAILGTTFVGFTFMWSEATRGREQLRSLRQVYVRRLGLGSKQVEEVTSDGRRHSYAINETEEVLRYQVDRGLGNKAYVTDLAALCRLVADTTQPGYVKQHQRLDTLLRRVGLDDDEIFDTYVLGDHLKRDPRRFFEKLYWLSQFSGDAPIMAELLERMEHDDIDVLLPRVERFESPKWLFALTFVVLIASIASGIIVLSGYDDSTHVAALGVPVGLSLLAMLLVSATVWQILTVD
jgi:hypothetical protein